MTDPLSITASIAAVAAAGVQVIALVEGLNSGCRNAPSEALRLATEMQAMGAVLGRLAEFSRSPGLDALLPQQLVDDLRPILGSCMLLFERTERIVGKLNKGMLAGLILARLRWVSKEKELEKLRIGISEHKLMLNMTLAVASCLATHWVHASTTRIEAHNEVILAKLNQLLSQGSEELANVSGTSSLIIRRFLDDITSYASSVCNSPRPSSIAMREAGMLEAPMELNPSYMMGEAGDIESWRRISEMKANVEIVSVSDSSLLRRRSQRGLDNTIPGTKQPPRRKPVSPLSPVFSASGTSIHALGGWSPAYDEPGSQLHAPSKLIDPVLPSTPDSGVYTADNVNTPTLATRTSFDEEREVLERLLITDPQRMHWLRVMLDKSNEDISPDYPKAVEPRRDAAGGSTDRILRLHEQNVPIIKVPIPLRELAAEESVPKHLVRHKVPAIEVPTPRRHGNATASLDGNSPQRVAGPSISPGIASTVDIYPPMQTRDELAVGAIATSVGVATSGPKVGMSPHTPRKSSNLTLSFTPADLDTSGVDRGYEDQRLSAPSEENSWERGVEELLHRAGYDFQSPSGSLDLSPVIPSDALPQPAVPTSLDPTMATSEEPKIGPVKHQDTFSSEESYESLDPEKMELAEEQEANQQAATTSPQAKHQEMAEVPESPSLTLSIRGLAHMRSVSSPIPVPIRSPHPVLQLSHGIVTGTTSTSRPHPMQSATHTRNRAVSDTSFNNHRYTTVAPLAITKDLPPLPKLPPLKIPTPPPNGSGSSSLALPTPRSLRARIANLKTQCVGHFTMSPTGEVEMSTQGPVRGASPYRGGVGSASSTHLKADWEGSYSAGQSNSFGLGLEPDARRREGTLEPAQRFPATRKRSKSGPPGTTVRFELSRNEVFGGREWGK